MTVTPASGPKVEGRLDRIDDFIVVVCSADGAAARIRAWATCRRSRSAIRSRAHKRAAADLYRPRHPQRHGLSGDAEMKTDDRLLARRRAGVRRLLSRRRPPTVADPAASISAALRSRWPTRGRPIPATTPAAASARSRRSTSTTVKNLTLAWVDRTGHRAGSHGRRRHASHRRRARRRGRRRPHPANVKGAILKVNGVLYVTAPDNVWAIDARDGRELWHYFWKTRGGTHIGNRGAAIWHNYLFFETPDNYLVSLDARTGKERWNVEIADFDEQYFSTPAPIVVDNHVLVGTGNDLDMPGFLQSFDPETGKLQWKFYTVPMNAGDPGLETWPSLEAARHGGGQVVAARRLRSGDAPVHLRHRQPDAGLHGRRARAATTCSPARWSPSTSTPARWRGTSRRRRTTRTTGIRRRRRS